MESSNKEYEVVRLVQPEQEPKDNESRVIERNVTTSEGLQRMDEVTKLNTAPPGPSTDEIKGGAM